VLRVESNFLHNPTFNTNPKPHLQIVLPCRHPCRTWGLGLGTSCEVVSPNFQALSQRLRLHGLTSSELGLRTWTPCEPALRRKTKKIVVHFAADFEASAAASLRKICTLQHLARGGGAPGMIVSIEDQFC
jgi:hypothetical protein